MTDDEDIATAGREAVKLMYNELGHDFDALVESGFLKEETDCDSPYHHVVMPKSRQNEIIDQVADQHGLTEREKSRMAQHVALGLPSPAYEETSRLKYHQSNCSEDIGDYDE